MPDHADAKAGGANTFTGLVADVVGHTKPGALPDINGRRSGRILLAAGNGDLRDYIERLLCERGLAVTTVPDGEAALEALRAHRPDLVITDATMPRLDGFELLRIIKNDAVLGDLSVIMLSARSGYESRVKGLEAGADDYLTKPFSARELIARIETHLATAQLRREASEAVRASENRMRALTNATSDVVFRMSPDWQKLRPLDGRGFVRDSDADMTDWLEQYTFPDDRPRILAAIETAIREKSLFELEHRVHRVDGSVGWTLSRAIPLLDEDGNIVEWFGIAADITERKKTEAALRESEERFRNMADHAPVMMWVTDADGRCTYLNRSWYEFTGQTRAEGEGIGWLEAVHPDDRDLSGAIFQEANENREPFQIEYRLRDRDGIYRWAIDSASPRFDAEGKFLGYIGSVLDIHERKKQESMHTLQIELLQLAMRDRPLDRILEEVIRMVEQHSQNDLLASILLLDDTGKRLVHGAAPSLPQAYNDAIHGTEIGPNVGSCGTAAYLKEAVYVSDIETDPLWKDFSELAVEHGLRACWSTPILSADGKVLGTFANYYRAPRTPAPSDIEAVELITRTVSLAIERSRFQEALRDEARLLETLNRTGASLAGDLDLRRVVQNVTDAGVELSGAQFGAFFYNTENDEGESYMLYALSGVDHSAFDRFPMPRNTKVFAPTFGGEGIVRSDDITKDRRYGHNAPYKGMPDGHLPVTSYLAVPVVSRGGDVIGGLFFGHSEPGRFNERHERLMAGIAGQAATALDNANLYEAAQREIRQRTAAEQALQQLNEQLETRVIEEIETRRHAEAALQQAQRMEAIGQLTGGVAHDFNNLLQVISSNLQLLSKDVANNERAEMRVQNAMAGVSRGAKLASQLLAFGRRQPLEPKVINIGRFVHGLDDMLRRALGEEIEVETTISEGLWNTFADPGQIENALLNLAINGRDAMDGAGKLTIEVGNAFLNDDYARLHPDVDPGQYVMLAVTDTGSGIPPDIIDKVFDPFFTTKTDGRGTGLGLSMVYGFAKQSNGHVKIYSERGHGTTVKLYLPRSHESEDVFVENDQQPPVGGTETVLVVEDDDEVRLTAVEMLSDLGYRVLRASDAASALAIIESGIPIDVLFSDVVMPGPVRSTELARKAKERLPGISVLFTSGYTENAIVHGGRLDEGVNLLPKPYTRESLARKIRAVLSENTAELPEAAPAEPPEAVPAESATGEATPLPSAGDVPSSEPPVILIVEDDILIRMGTVDMLEDTDAVILEAGSGEEAIEILNSQTVDVLVTDLGLPDMPGTALATQAREIREKIGIVFATGRTEIPEGENVPDNTVLVSKPFNGDKLQNAIEKARSQDWS